MYEGSKHMTFVHALSGAISKAIATMITYPLFVLRTKKQSLKKNYKEILYILYKMGGLKAFYRGI